MRHKPKKSLGQNFLIDGNIQRKLIAACKLRAQDTVLEIGSGEGQLTQAIAAQVKSLDAFEIDAGLCKILRAKLYGYPNLEIFNQDILKFKIKRHYTKVIGNIPYYITTPIIEHLLEYRNKIDAIFLTVQKEFSARITAAAGSKNYGALSCFIQYFTQAKNLFFIKKTCFFPRPKVDSSFLRLEVRKTPAVKVKDEEMFFQIIRGAFNKRRKTLRNSLAGIIPQERLKAFFQAYGIDENIRPEKLTLENFANLAKNAYLER
ncbi:MAG: 16S rRNA (adenine(1518)-N(6)/adenine(1519)-N(6))-dimethyltransferase RsmA [Candidatus Omnitrophota bacterium]|jgi:16S rRNA (adenine1518-N6/adenine1519-N6)-dimethyltransferase